MNRRIAPMIVMLFLTSAPVQAQAVAFRVGAAPANVYKGPSTGSAIIGHASRGATLEVTRELGSWVKIVWPTAQDHVGYVHVTAGSLTRSAGAAAPPPPAAAAASSPPPSAASTPPREAPRAAARPSYVTRPAHTLGVGGLIGGPDPVMGVTARAWWRQPFGLQLELSRSALGDEPRRVTSIRVAPSVVYALHDRVGDYWWVRPYVGAGPSLQHQSTGGILPRDGDLLSGTRVGVQFFGGVEATFASLPQLSVSADIGYRGQPTVLVGVEPAGVGVVVSAHWYLK
jgi:Bacterial SH3 domain